MTRDTKGRFTRDETEIEESIWMEKKSVFDRPPTVKVFLLFLVLIWVLSLFLPSSETTVLYLKHKMCNCSVNQTPEQSSPFDAFSTPTGNSINSQNKPKER